jgi:hypothetical protein
VKNIFYIVFLVVSLNAKAETTAATTINATTADQLVNLETGTSLAGSLPGLSAAGLTSAGTAATQLAPINLSGTTASALEANVAASSNSADATNLALALYSMANSASVNVTFSTGTANGATATGGQTFTANQNNTTPVTGRMVLASDTPLQISVNAQQANVAATSAAGTYGNGAAFSFQVPANDQLNNVVYKFIATPSFGGNPFEVDVEVFRELYGVANGNKKVAVYLEPTLRAAKACAQQLGKHASFNFVLVNGNTAGQVAQAGVDCTKGNQSQSGYEMDFANASLPTGFAPGYQFTAATAH